MRTIHKVLWGLILIPLIGVLSCSSGPESASNSQPGEPAYAGKIAEDILQAMNSGDYASFSHYFDDVMKRTIPEDTFRQYDAVYKERIGTYLSKVYWQTTVQDGSKIVQYKARFSQDPSDVILSITFQEIDKTPSVSGVYFMSPKIRGYS